MRTPLLLLSLVPACSLNPAFDPPGSGGQDTTTASATTGAPDPTTAGPDDDPTGSTGAPATTQPADPGDTDATTDTSDGSSTGDGSSTSDGSSTGDSSGADSGPDVNDPVHCWDDEPDSFGPPLTLDQFADKDPTDPVIAADGLSIVYMATEERRPFRSFREQPGDPFPNGEQIALWPDDTLKPGYPRFTLDDKELLLSSQGDLYTATFKGGDIHQQYLPPTPLAGVNTDFEESIPTVSADGKLLLVQRDDGPALNPAITTSWRFHQFTRDSPAPGAPFTPAGDVTPFVPPLGLALCPTLSADALHLFFASTDDPDLTLETAPDLVFIYYTRRDDPAAPWQPPQKLTTIAPGGATLCPTSVTADGCTLNYIKFPLSRANQSYTMYVASRAP